MYKILTKNKISHVGLQHFAKSKYIYGDDVENPDAMVVRSASLHDAEFPPSIKGIARAGAGVNNIPIDRCSESGIVVFNTPGANANAVKELTMMALLMSARKVAPALEWVGNLKGEDDVAALVEKGKAQFSGPELKGKKLGVIGLGTIGMLVANLALNFDMEVYGYDPYLNVDAAWNLDRSVKHAMSLDEIFANCDFITLHIPSTSETRGTINSESIKNMKRGVRIINFSRGDLVVAEDMIEALNNGEVRCYITDFPSNEFIGVAGAIQIPHLGASTPESEDNCASMAAKQLVDFLENGNIKNAVNLPNVYMPRGSGENRLTIIHYNKPSMINQITGAISATGINIENFTDKSRKDYAYTIIDTLDKIKEETIEKLNALDGVIRVTAL